jgi:Protein of unknown function (DUF3485)
MKSVLNLFVCCVLVFGTYSGGWLQRQNSNRWDSAGALRLAGEQLRQPLPNLLGNWRLVGERHFADDVVRALQCRAYVCRSYTNDQTGDIVSVAVLVGPPGPMSVHTPEICYSSKDYQVTAGRVPTKVDDESGQQHVLWELKLAADDMNRAPLRVLYGWGTGGPWLATRHPRFTHAGATYLYKIHLAAPATEVSDNYDPCQDFLRSFLPELRRHLVSQDASARGSPEPPAL